MAKFKKYRIIMVEKTYKTIEVEATSKKSAIEEAENASDEDFDYNGDYWDAPEVYQVEVIE